MKIKRWYRRSLASFLLAILPILQGGARFFVVRALGEWLLQLACFALIDHIYELKREGRLDEQMWRAGMKREVRGDTTVYYKPNTSHAIVFSVRTQEPGNADRPIS